ncbi:T9SS type A sorting domain-containing protein [Fluviicola sp.]|uniref:T9SS type A sorting domain-containing protein n=1 Tax=Fluviicola sp. TaxID=1917219 RepID=UPI003D2CE298
MKQVWSVFIGIICCMHLAQAQPYKPLLDNLNEWHFTTCFSGCNTDVYYTDGDTVMGGKTYKILDGYHYISRTFLLYEDVPNRTVTLAKINPTKIDEFLLYDFAKNEGDTMELFNPNSPFIVDPGFFQLDSIRLRPLEDGNSYRHFYWSPTPGNTTYNAYPVWVEGVGSLSLINAAGAEPDFNGVGQLNCFFKNNDGFYVNLDSIVSCEPVHLLGVSEFKNSEWDIYPNPLSRELNVNDQLPGQTYVILNLQGLEVSKGIIDSSKVIQVAFLSNGNYFLKIGEQLRKFSKQE